MKTRWKERKNHPVLSQIGKLNPMFGKKHTIESIQKMSLNRSKIPVNLYNKYNKYIIRFISYREVARYLNIPHPYIYKKLKSGKLILNKYWVRKTENE